jgi:hypothetical protein
MGLGTTGMDVFPGEVSRSFLAIEIVHWSFGKVERCRKTRMSFV